MAKFQSYEEYEKWKEGKIKSNQKSTAITEQPWQISPCRPQRKKKFWYIALSSLAVVIIIFAAYNFYENHYTPKKIAEGYLKAIQLHDYENMSKLSSGVRSNVLINLISWNFVDSKKISSIKKPLDISESQYNELLKLALEAYNVTSADALPLESLREYLKSYNSWRTQQLETFKPIEEGGSYYYYSRPALEYLLDITASNKLGIELKKKYILRVEKNFTGWKITKFDER